MLTDADVEIGMLDDDTLAAMGALKLRLMKLRESIKATNAMAAQIAPDLPQLETFDVGFLTNELIHRINAHFRAMEQRQQEAIERLDRFNVLEREAA